MFIPEIAAPAGSLEKLKIAVLYGANAVYLAGKKFGLRSAANNFSNEELIKAVQFATQHHCKIYVTLNSFLHDSELDALPDFLSFLETIGINAVICSDFGVIATVLKHSSIPVHISTQASVINSWHASIWKKIGAKRIVLGREVSIEEAKQIKETTDIELEMFIHGAMCMSFSGHCTISNYTAGRDSNRGGCVQSCRHEFKMFHQKHEQAQTTFMSSKDLMGLSYLQKFIDAGIDSLKIEGRMKTHLYVGSVVKAYSETLKRMNTNKNVPFSYWENELNKLPHREYTEGSLINPANENSIYFSNLSQNQEYELAGFVMDIDLEKQKIAISVRTKLTLGLILEILPFRGSYLKIPLLEMKDVTGNTKTITQPGSVIWIPCDIKVEVYNIIRVSK